MWTSIYTSSKLVNLEDFRICSSVGQLYRGSVCIYYYWVVVIDLIVIFTKMCNWNFGRMFFCFGKTNLIVLVTFDQNHSFPTESCYISSSWQHQQIKNEATSIAKVICPGKTFVLDDAAFFVGRLYWRTSDMQMI